MKWLREQVAQRMETAREACGPAWRLDVQASCECCTRVVRAQSGALVVTPDDRDAPHVALNDPQDVIARCEAELAIITRCESVHAAFADPAGGLWPDVTRRERSHAFATLADLASSYKHREGYAEHWSEGR